MFTPAVLAFGIACFALGFAVAAVFVERVDVLRRWLERRQTRRWRRDVARRHAALFPAGGHD